MGHGSRRSRSGLADAARDGCSPDGCVSDVIVEARQAGSGATCCWSGRMAAGRVLTSAPMVHTIFSTRY